MPGSDPVKLSQYSVLTLDGSTAAVVMDMALTPDDNTNARVNYGAHGELVAARGLGSGTCSFTLEAMNANPFDPFIKACDGSNTSTGVYKFLRTDTNVEFISNEDGERAVLSAARGTFVFNATVGQVPTFAFTFTGAYRDTSSAATASITPLAAVPPTFGDPTTTVTFDGSNVAISTISIDLGNTVQPRVDANASNGMRGAVIVNRATRITLDPESSPIPWRTYFNTQAVVPLSVKVGSFTFTGQVQVIQAPRGDRDGILTRQITLATVDRNDGQLTLTIAA